MPTEPDWVRDVLSRPRFAPYLSKTGDDLGAAIQLYWWNVGVSAAFYAPLHCLEMALRNAVHQQLAIKFGRTDWWEVAPLNKSGLRIVGIPEASWPIALGRALPTTWWPNFPLVSGFRSSAIPITGACGHRACTGLFPSIAGYEGLCTETCTRCCCSATGSCITNQSRHRHLEADHQTILRLLGCLSPSMVEQLKSYDQVEVVLGQGPGRSSSAFPGGAQ